MTPNTPAGMVVVKKEEKEPKLRQLVIDGLARLNGKERGTVSLRLVAQSVSSPVARAVTLLQRELAEAGVEARIILTRIDATPMTLVGSACSYRHLADVRCHDSHELLVLGTETTWIGDCLRRDPSVRDSYELHSVGSAQAARNVALSFDKLWQLSATIMATEDPATLAMAADLAGLPTDQGSQPTALTRH